MTHSLLFNKVFHVTFRRSKFDYTASKQRFTVLLVKILKLTLISSRS